MRREHWALQASLMHSSNDNSFAASGLDASAFASRALGRTGLVGGKLCSVGVSRLRLSRCMEFGSRQLVSFRSCRTALSDAPMVWTPRAFYSLT